MDQQRQKAFQKLRPVCVELSSVALKFKGRQTSVKDVLHALEAQHQVIQDIGHADHLDEKLAEYAFFPLTHVFNESQRLSQRCLQVTVESVIILVTGGWRAKLSPPMGKQLLILMTLLAGGDTRKGSQPPNEELKCAAFKCIEVLIGWLARSTAGKTVLEDQNTRNVVDQLAYLLVENLTEASSDDVQISAAQALFELNTNISNRVFLASLLPRTVSSLTKALRPSTVARRTRNVLTTDLKLLSIVLLKILADDVAFRLDQNEAEKQVLDTAWLAASATQIKSALIQVCELRNHNQIQVREALFEFCITIIQDCGKTLKESIPVLIETAVVLAGNTDDERISARLENLINTHQDLSGMLQSSFYDWSQTLPRVMQGNDDKIKEIMLARVTNSFSMLSKTLSNSDYLTTVLSQSVLKSIANVVESTGHKQILVYQNEANNYTTLVHANTYQERTFESVILSHQSQKGSAQALHRLIDDLRNHPSANQITRAAVDNIANFGTDLQIAPIWLAVQLLRQDLQTTLKLDDILDLSELSDEKTTSSAYLIQDLYTQTKDILLGSSPYSSTEPTDPRLVALALECVTLQAQQLGQSYRTELYETLYPILALLSSQDAMIQNHAITALNLLASCCEYTSVSALLIENVDYLVNSLAWKLNTFNLSPEAPAVLNMVIQLVGAKVIPHLDDLVASIFAALDSFHGYTQWVEMLFEVLRTMIDESVKNPYLAITNENSVPVHKKRAYQTSTIDDILSDLQSRQRRRPEIESETDRKSLERAPQRPWTKPLDDPNYKPDPTEGKDIETLLREAEIADQENDLPAPNDSNEPKDEDLDKPQSKSHDLLLKIARATVPHLSSPSPRVRQILLQLLGQITPLLARHEYTFLPLVNAIWPGIVQRLFANVTASTSTTDEPTSEGETAYNIAAAAGVAASICEHAGDFMATRIEQIFTQLQRMHTRLWKDVQTQMARNDSKKQKPTGPSHSTVIADTEDVKGRNISGTVDLNVVRHDESHPGTGTALSSSTATSSLPLSTVSRTSTGQIFASLTRLLTSIITHVHLPSDTADAVFHMLAPLVDHPGDTGKLVDEALETYNSDAVWVLRVRRLGEGEILAGKRSLRDRVWRGKGADVPCLRESLVKEGLALCDVVF